MSERIIRAKFDDESITVYQAYNHEITRQCLVAQTFVSPPFKVQRMTWIKPSFLWMMYRSGWATKKDQEHVLAIKIKRSGFSWALENSCLSHFNKDAYSSHEDWKSKLSESSVRIQWDPERDIHLNPLRYRSIQIGLSGSAVEKYLSDWIVQIEDITQNVHQIHELIKIGNLNRARELLPNESAYPVSDSLKNIIHCSRPL